MIETAKRDIGDLIKTYVTEFNNNVFASYPKSDVELPCACVDVVSAAGDGAIEAEIHSYLVRISVFADDRLKLDQLVEKIITTFINHGKELKNCYYSRLQSISPINFAFEDRDNVWRRDIDIKVITILKR